ncbi:hypothetical protein DES53_10687 [Roseimicrobium gellanilyticum]|uniref:Glycosyltransferase RgtA/B/C/D-like domain-containing protein n=1 Tax=Roseimicrobium gellanilyticum TaxID=748857 RepID=A0A366HI42_9BACT|nr:hypothetical protein [Roseimicrobium gellanilyticum]RBP42381.1 hypothetical protein DES53_10687 [Roseimicrobium gellanilyticum]
MPHALTTWWETRPAALTALATAALGLLLLLAAVVQDQFGTLSQRIWPMPAAEKLKQDGFAWKTKLPEWGRGSVAAHEVQFLKDGVPTGIRVPHASTIVEKGQGTYKIQKDYIYFSLPGNENPEPYVRSLALLLPRPVSEGWWVISVLLLVAGGTAAARHPEARKMAADAADKLNAVSALTVVGAVFAVALVTTLWRLPAALEYSEGCFSVKGVPYSDAAGWDELAINMAAGRGFEGGFAAQRPLYPAMVSLIYMLTGPSLLVAKMLNAFWLALAAAVVCAIGVKAGSRLAGLAGAMEIAFGEDYISFSQLMLTETLGVLFGTAAVLALGVALAKPEVWRIALAAVLLACANLASGFGFFALIGYGLVAFVTWKIRNGLFSALGRTIFLAFMVALTWAPWIARQHIVHGVNNLSTSSANLMYATATEDGRWSTEVAAEWQQDGVANTHGERYRYYMEKYRAAVKDHPGRYLQTIWRGITTFFQWWEFHGPDHFGVVLIGLLGAAAFLFRQVEAWAAAVSAVLVLLATLALHGLSAVWMWPLATILVLYVSPPERRPLWALVAVGIPFVALLTGMTGGSLGRRMWTCCEWGMPLMLVAGGAGFMRVLATLLLRGARRQSHGPTFVPTVAPVVQDKRNSKQKRRSTGYPARGVTSFASLVGVLLIAHASVASVAATAFYLLNKDKPKAVLSVSPETRQQMLDAARKEYPVLGDARTDDPRLLISVCKFGEYVCELGPSENQNHWARSFETRPYERTVAFVQQLEHAGTGRATLQLRAVPADIPRGEPVLVIGVRNIDPKAHLGHDVEMIEVLGFVPVSVNAQQQVTIPDMTKATWPRLNPEAEKILQPVGIP